MAIPPDVAGFSDDAHVGCAGLWPVPAGEGVLELGFHLRTAYWDQGLATEAARAVVTVALTTAAAGAFVAGHHPENDASRRVLERLGCRQTHDAYYAPTRLDHPTYLLTAAAESGRAAPPAP